MESIKKQELLKHFLLEHNEEYNNFKKSLIVLRCSLEAYDNYLNSFSFEYEPFGAFNISYFYEYCKENNICIAEDRAEELHFNKLSCDYHGWLFSNSGDEELYLCHPNDLFKNIVITDDIDYMLNIDWDNIDIEKMFNLNNFSLLAGNTFNDYFSILTDRFNDLRSKYNKPFSLYNVLLSNKIIDGECNYKVRAIFRQDFLGIDYAINSNYLSNIKALKKVIK